MASTNLGKVVITPKGEYVPETVYNRLDLVRFEGSSFLVLQDGVVGVTPSDDGQNWIWYGLRAVPFLYYRTVWLV